MPKEPILKKILAIAAALLTIQSFAQDGVSAGGAARTRYLSNVGLLPTSREVVVEDFVNYHRHEIPRPKAGEAVGLDLRWGAESVAPGSEAILQVGLSTSLAHDRAQLRPLNLAIVIDKSGSMSEFNKLTRVKSALLTLVSQLRPVDTLSLVVFDSDAQVILPAEKVTDKERIKSLIEEIQPGSTTNLNGGLMLGYQEASKHFQKEATNRVILLTDGIANRGVTDPAEIARASQTYNDRGIDLSTIGVGTDLNKDLLMKLAKSGRGLFHFIGDTDDIQKVFVNELQSLLSPVAADPDLKIEYGNGLTVQKVYGYNAALKENNIKFKLDNLNSGATEVVLVRFKANAESDSPLPVTVRLTYFDLNQNKTVVKTEQTTISASSTAKEQNLSDTGVAKDFAIAQLAQAMKDMAKDCEANQYRQAQSVLDAAIRQTSKQYPNLDDEDIKRTLTIAEKYQSILHSENRSRYGTIEEDGPTQPEGQNIIANGDFSQGNIGFTSGLSYVQPTWNCLWPAAYTVAPTWNAPLLHRLFAGEPFPAAKRPNGNEQVFYANAGETGQIILWSAVVNCKPSTVYQISFQNIVLNSGAEWMPNYQIKVDDACSDPQPGSFGEFGPVTMKWYSRRATTATVSIVRMPMDHRGGLIGISNIEMVPISH